MALQLLKLILHQVNMVLQRQKLTLNRIKMAWKHLKLMQQRMKLASTRNLDTLFFKQKKKSNISILIGKKPD